MMEFYEEVKDVCHLIYSVPATETVQIQSTYCSTTAHGTQSNKILYCLTLDFVAVSGNIPTSGRLSSFFMDG